MEYLEDFTYPDEFTGTTRYSQRYILEHPGEGIEYINSDDALPARVYMYPPLNLVCECCGFISRTTVLSNKYAGWLCYECAIRGREKYMTQTD